MMTYEYKVVPAPARGLKSKGIKTHEDRFAHALETAMNELAADGWEYLRADTLPCEQRDGLISKTTVYQNILIYRRKKETRPAEVAPTAPQIRATRKVKTPEPSVKTPEKTATGIDDEPVEISDPDVSDTDRKRAQSSDVAAE